MRFYVYIADAKIDAVLAELTPDERERLAHELNADPALLHAAETPKGAPDELRFARADAVARQLEAEGRCAPLAASSAYVADRLELHWGRLRHMRGGELLRHETESPVAFLFGGEAGELVMIGSASHLLAQPPKATVDHAGEPADEDAQHWFAAADAAPELDAIDRRCLEYVFEDAPPPLPIADPAGTPNEAQPGERAGADASWMERLARVRRELRALPAQRLEIVAKRVLVFDHGEWNESSQAFDRRSPVVLAAPLSIAMVV